jgi:hypothetical protein
MPQGFSPQPGQMLYQPRLGEEFPTSDVVFCTSPEEKEPSMVAAVIKAAEENEKPPSISVKVVAPYRVSHEGKAFVGGDTLEVPNDKEHQIWLQSGWVQEVKSASSAKKEI